MKTPPIQYPPWPLGCTFVNSEARKFEVVQTIYGDPTQAFSYRIDLVNGCSIHSQGESYPQTAVGFVEIGSDKLIKESVTNMDAYVKNGHLKII